MRKPTSKQKPRKPYLVVLVLVATFAFGLFAGAYYESRQVRGCACFCAIPQVVN